LGGSLFLYQDGLDGFDGLARRPTGGKADTISAKAPTPARKGETRSRALEGKSVQPEKTEASFGTLQFFYWGWTDLMGWRADQREEKRTGAVRDSKDRRGAGASPRPMKARQRTRRAGAPRHEVEGRKPNPSLVRRTLSHSGMDTFPSSDTGSPTTTDGSVLVQQQGSMN
jgi:hypothetical protein